MTDQPVQTGPANSVTDQETGSRVYIHPITQERFTSVTTVLQVVAKTGLPYWAAKVVQEKALDMLPLLVKATRRRGCGQKGDDRCAICIDCVALELRRSPDAERDEAADRGTRLHAVAEHYALTGEIRTHDQDIAEHVKQWLRWHTTHQVQFVASEVTVINRTYGYAGTLDFVATCGWMPPKWNGGKSSACDLTRVPLFGDYKSGKGIYDEHAWQLAAYRNAEAVMLPDGTEMPMPAGHAEYGLSVQIRPDDFWQRPLRVCDRSFGGFLSALRIYRDISDDEFDLVGRAMYKPREVTEEPPAQLPATPSATSTVDPFALTAEPEPSLPF